LKGDVAKIWCCSLGGELTSIDEVVREKLKTPLQGI
jgi:hypothetical protein